MPCTLRAAEGVPRGGRMGDAGPGPLFTVAFATMCSSLAKRPCHGRGASSLQDGASENALSGSRT